MVSDRNQFVATQDDHGGVARAAEPGRTLCDRLEDRDVIDGRLRDRAEDLADRSLSLQGLLRLVDETHVLDRDDGLVGEGSEQLDLLLGERTDLETSQPKRADRLALAK